VRRIVQRCAIAAADTWAIVKFGAGVLVFPIGAVVVTIRAVRNTTLARDRVLSFPSQVAAVRLGITPSPPANRMTRLDSSAPTVIVSDLHRCFPGPRDWTKRQGTKPLYAAMLDHYTSLGYRVVENGDIEDHWMVGGTPYGQWYDAARVATRLIPGRTGVELRRALTRRHLRIIVDNHDGIYQRLRLLGEAGRLVRTVGNHDDVSLDPVIAQSLSGHLGGAPVVDYVVLEDNDGEAAAVVTHGHQTDGWNAPGRSDLGQLATWLACTLSDTPGLEAPETVPPRSLTAAFLSGALPNVLLRISPRFGANRSYDSLDEESLFDAFGGAAESGPWLLLGHTHLPVMQPLSRSGVRWARYANSGNGLWFSMITALEWDPATGSPLLVAWVLVNRSTADAVPPEAIVGEVEGTPVARVVMRTTPDGRRLVPDVDASAAIEGVPT